MFLQSTSQIIIDKVFGNVITYYNNNSQKFQQWSSKKQSFIHPKQYQYLKNKSIDHKYQSVLIFLQKKQPIQLFNNQIQPYLNTFQFKSKVFQRIRNHSITLHNAYALITHFKIFDKFFISSQNRCINLQEIISTLACLIDDLCLLERSTISYNNNSHMMELNCTIFYLLSLINHVKSMKIKFAKQLSFLFKQQNLSEKTQNNNVQFQLEGVNNLKNPFQQDQTLQTLSSRQLKIILPIQQMKNFTATYQQLQLQPIQQKVHSLHLLIHLLTITIPSSFSNKFNNEIQNITFEIFNNMKGAVQSLLESFQYNNRNMNIDQSQLYIKLQKKAIAMFQMEGFVSPKGLFKQAYKIYSINQTIQLIKCLSSIQPFKQNTLYEWIIQLFDTSDHYQYDISQNQASIIAQIIWNQKLFLRQMNQKTFLNQFIQDIIGAHTVFKRDKHYTLNQSLTNCVFKKRNNQDYPIVQFIQSQEILLLILKQIYMLKLQYLHIIQYILKKSHEYSSRQQTIKLQFYLLKNQFVHFLLEECQCGYSLESFFSCIGLMTKRNHIIRAVTYFILHDNRKALLNLVKSIKNYIKPARQMILYFLIEEKQLQEQYYHENQSPYPNFILKQLFCFKSSVWLSYFCNIVKGNCKNNTNQDIKIIFFSNKQSNILWITLILLLYDKYSQEEDVLSQIFSLNLSLTLQIQLDCWESLLEKNNKRQLIKRGISYYKLKSIKDKIIQKLQLNQQKRIKYKTFESTLTNYIKLNEN